MIRKIVEINEEKCTGCGLCAKACHESAIQIQSGKARLIKDDYCDGLGDCLPACPADAIRIIEREAADYDEAAVRARQASLRETREEAAPSQKPSPSEAGSELLTWPVQIQLAPVKADYFHGANLLVASDCTAYAYAGFHKDFIRGHVVLIGCPKLDPVDYSEKLAAILRENDVQSLHVVRMEVPCCGGMEYAVKKALEASGKNIPCQVTTISLDGKIL